MTHEAASDISVAMMPMTAEARSSRDTRRSLSHGNAGSPSQASPSSSSHKIVEPLLAVVHTHASGCPAREDVAFLLDDGVKDHALSSSYHWSCNAKFCSSMRTQRMFSLPMLPCAMNLPQAISAWR